jgi:hypothetical protein
VLFLWQVHPLVKTAHVTVVESNVSWLSACSGATMLNACKGRCSAELKTRLFLFSGSLQHLALLRQQSVNKKSCRTHKSTVGTKVQSIQIKKVPILLSLKKFHHSCLRRICGWTMWDIAESQTKRLEELQETHPQ